MNTRPRLIFISPDDPEYYTVYFDSILSEEANPPPEASTTILYASISALENEKDDAWDQALAERQDNPRDSDRTDSEDSDSPSKEWGSVCGCVCTTHAGRSVH
eukprot:9497487-Pyramimonas_sp.AAC.1